jgi:hypothetical protein
MQLSDMLREKKKTCRFSPNFFFLIKKMHYGNNIICKAISNLCKLDDANTEKQSLDLLFMSSPTRTCKVLSIEIGGKTQLVPRLHTEYSK